MTSKNCLRNLLSNQKIGIPRLLHDNPLEHLFHDHFNVLVINLHTLETIHFLNLIHEISLQLFFPQDIQNIMRIGSTIHEWFTSAYAVTFVDIHILTPRDQILTLFIALGRNQHLARTPLKATEPDNTVNFRNDCLLFWLPSLKKLCHTGYTTSNILSFCCLARNLRDCIPR